MKKYKRTARVCLTVLAACGLMFLPASAPKMDVQAAEVIATVQGKVAAGTTAKLLCLDTTDGRMEIKIDGETNTSSCKMLLPKKEINVALSHGSDGYLHAVTISEEAIDPSDTVLVSPVTLVTGVCV